MTNFFEETFKFFEDLSTKPEVGGLQITNSSVQYVSFQNGEDKPEYHSLKLSPGVIDRGNIVDEQKLLEVLQALHKKIAVEKPKERIKVVLCLPSDIAFTQNFSIPNVGKKRLEESAELNLQMVSPIQAENAYMSWQLVSETQDKFGLLGAFANRSIVDKFKSILLASDFHPIAIEFPSLSLSWTVNKVIGPKNQSLLILNVSSDGIDIFLLRNGYIYFDYFKSWKTIQGSDEQISQEKFNAAIVKEVKRVVNFTSSHFNESLQYVFLIAPGLEKRIKSVLDNSFSFKSSVLQVKFGELGPAWYAVIGSAIRANWRREKDRFISLGTVKVEQMFYREQTLDFIIKWRNIFIGAIFVFFVLLGGSSILLRVQPNIIESRLNYFNIAGQQSELNELKPEVERFNTLVNSIKTVRKSSGSIPIFLSEFRSIASTYSINLNAVNIPNISDTIRVSARAVDSNTVIRFKNELIEHPKFSSINLPFSEIIAVEGNYVNFNISFSYEDPNVED